MDVRRMGHLKRGGGGGGRGGGRGENRREKSPDRKRNRTRPVVVRHDNCNARRVSCSFSS